MRVAVPREIKDNEFRVAITPAGVQDLVAHHHEVFVETAAGIGSSIPDEEYAAAGARITPDAASTWEHGELILKVKEPIAIEYDYFRKDLLLFAYLHLAAEAELTAALLRASVTAIAYETVQLTSGALPLLAPMSEVAGRLAPLVGANAMLRPHGGPGLLVSGVPGTRPAQVVVLGGGVAGSSAISVAMGLGADVTVLDTNLQRLRELDAQYSGRLKTIASNSVNIETSLLGADLVIGSVLVPGAKAPTLVSNDLVSRMKPGSVLVDIAVDQGGCFADSRPTTHAAPTFDVHNSLFYCVANMPGAVPRTSTYALTNATLPPVRALANLGWKQALRSDPSLAIGLNTHAGTIVNPQIARAHGFDNSPLNEVLA
ncbi:MAG: alanine dehydrogenase [Rhodoglobus sp.]